ncbi:unnamed protein product [Ceutorhynchus assimilis]|uniref:Small ribosomal subunit protein uS12m n=1 Tax=Ceutorhynchus assimilis TaxID=467358 RepID=A0A9N9MD37_9CUCU|nr:unnamed protein product [Ceutorhynchus assimilis]
MNILQKLIRNVPLRPFVATATENSLIQKINKTGGAPISSPSLATLLNDRFSALSMQDRGMATLAQMHRTGPHRKFNVKKRAIDGQPFMKGVVLKTLIKKPKKPNSANRKCVLVRLSNGKEMVAYIPGIGHNLQEHNIVLCRMGRVQDCPGVKLKCVRGKYDLGHVIIQK